MHFSSLFSQHGIVFGIIALAAMVTVHEFGHFFAARAAGIRIYEFSLGFGQTLFKKVDRNGVTWSIRAIPLGGFVYMERRNPDFGKKSEPIALDGAYYLFTWIRERVTYKAGKKVGDAVIEETIEHVYHSSNVDPEGNPIRTIALEDVSLAWQTVVLLAGIASNILFAAVCFSASLMIGFDVIVGDDKQFDLFEDSTTIVTIKKEKLEELTRDHRVVVGAMDMQLIAADMGIQVGDVILAVDGVPVDSSEDAAEALYPYWRGQDFTIQFERGGEVFDLAYFPEYVDEVRPSTQSGGESDPNDEMPWVFYNHGITFSTVGNIAFPVMGATFLGTVEAIGGTWLSVVLTVDAVEGLFESPKEAMEGMAGPVGTVVMMDQMAVQGMAAFLQVAGLISLSIAALNLMPLPVLDGGQVILVFARRLLGRFSFYKWIERGMQISGVLLLIVWMIAITFHDIAALF